MPAEKPVLLMDFPAFDHTPCLNPVKHIHHGHPAALKALAIRVTTMGIFTLPSPAHRPEFIRQPARNTTCTPKTDIH